MNTTDQPQQASESLEELFWKLDRCSTMKARNNINKRIDAILSRTSEKEST